MILKIFMKLFPLIMKTISLSIIHTGEFFNPGRLPDSLLMAIGELLEAKKISKKQLQGFFYWWRRI